MGEEAEFVLTERRPGNLSQVTGDHSADETVATLAVAALVNTASATLASVAIALTTAAAGITAHDATSSAAHAVLAAATAASAAAHAASAAAAALIAAAAAVAARSDAISAADPASLADRPSSPEGCSSTTPATARALLRQPPGAAHYSSHCTWEDGDWGSFRYKKREFSIQDIIIYHHIS